MADAMVGPVDVPRILLVDPLDRATEVPLRALYLEVVVIGHQAVGVEDQSPSHVGLCQYLEEGETIRLVKEDVFSGDVIW